MDWLRTSTISLAALLLPVSARLHALEPQIQQAQQFSLKNADLVNAPETATPMNLQSSATEDFDSFGVQQMLKDNERPKPFSVFADISAFVTNNVALARHGERSDSFLVATFGLGYTKAFSNGLQFDIDARGSMFRYDRFRVLDFTSVDTGMGVSYHAEKLAGLDFFLRYNFNMLISAPTEEIFFKNHTIKLGAQRVFSLGTAHYAFLGIDGELGFGAPKSEQRSSVSAYAGYHLQITQHLEGDLLYRYTDFIYAENGRNDQYHTLSLGLKYVFRPWCSVSASGFAGWNRSNYSVFNYNVANGGVGLTLSLQF